MQWGGGVPWGVRVQKYPAPDWEGLDGQSKEGSLLQVWAAPPDQVCTIEMPLGCVGKVDLSFTKTV